MKTLFFLLIAAAIVLFFVPVMNPSRVDCPELDDVACPSYEENEKVTPFVYLKIQQEIKAQDYQGREDRLIEEISICSRYFCTASSAT
jgi:hypothetical protein